MTRTMLRRSLAAAASLLLAGSLLVACAGSPPDPARVRVGWALDLPPLDPAASDSVASFAILSQLYPSLLTVESGEPVPVPEIAASAEWTAEGVYTVVLKSGLVFANGDSLTTSDVKFSIERQRALQSRDGAWRQFANLDEVRIVDDTTIEFQLKSATDAGFPYVLAGPAGLVLDEEVFFADELTSDEEILAAEPFAGPFSLTRTRGEELVLTPYGGYAGVRPAASTIELRPGDADDLARQLDEGSLDIVTGRLPVDTLETLAENEAVTMVRAASGRARLLAFDFEHMPYGSRTETPDAGLAAAVRVAVSELIDREALVTEVGSNWVRPLESYIADGVPGASDFFASLHGDGTGGPSLERAQGALAAVGIPTPVALTLHVDLDQVGGSGSAEVAVIAEQLEDGGLFDVDVIETDAAGLGEARVAGDVQLLFTSVLPANSDPQDYLAFFRSTSLAIPGYADPDVDALLARQASELDPATRAATLAEVQSEIATQLPAIPVTQGVRVVFARLLIEGIELDAGFPLDFTRLRR